MPIIPLSDRTWVVLFVLLAAGAGCTDEDAPDAVVLMGLEIIGAPSSLNPPFDPNILRYSFTADDQSHLAIVPSVSEGAGVAINGRIAPAATPYSLAQLAPGQTVEIQVYSYRRNRLSRRYELLYLPRDFPDLVVTATGPEASADPLYVSLNNDAAKYLAIVDNHGVPLFYRADNQFLFDFKWHAATGERSYLRYTGSTNQWGRRNAEAVVLDANFNEVDRFTTVGLSNTDVHDVLLTAHGEVILIAYEGTRRDLSYLGLSTEELVEESVIQVLDRASRAVLFQ